jgi:NADH-quinone oxidoreductase subunit L
MEEIHHAPLWVKLAPAVVMILGFLIALQAYVRSTTLPERFVAQFRVLHAFLLNKWYFDELYHYLFVIPAFGFGRIFWKAGDEGTIDRFGPNGAAALVSGGNRLTARLQSGYLYTYALVMLLGLAAAATWAMAR